LRENFEKVFNKLRDYVTIQLEGAFYIMKINLSNYAIVDVKEIELLKDTLILIYQLISFQIY
jgi:hypothetical protein